MANETLKDDEDDALEVVEVETLPDPAAPPAEDDADKDDAEDKDASGDETEDEEDAEDQRLAEADEEDPQDKNKKKRTRRREAQKQARDRTLAEVDSLRELVRTQGEQIRRLAGGQHTSSVTEIRRQIAEVEDDIRTADSVMAAAMEANNGQDFVTAQTLRDQARDRLRDLKRTEESLGDEPQASGEGRDALVGQWKRDNPWYGQSGNEAATTIVNTIDAQIRRDGYDWNDASYYRELTRRVGMHFEEARRVGDRRTNGDGRRNGEAETSRDEGRKRVTPMGNGREHAPRSTREGVYVTPERKQAMIEAGVWDDPAKRKRYLKAYADFDREQSANR